MCVICFEKNCSKFIHNVIDLEQKRVFLIEMNISQDGVFSPHAAHGQLAYNVCYY
jgi:hypothetical protein